MKTNHIVLIVILVLLVLSAWTTAPPTPKPVVVEGFFADWLKPEKTKNRDALAKAVNAEIRERISEGGLPRMGMVDGPIERYT